MTDLKFKEGDIVIVLSCGYYPEYIGRTGVVYYVSGGPLPYKVVFEDGDVVSYYEHELRLKLLDTLGELGD